MEALPPTMMRPADLVEAGRARLDHAPALFGPIEIVGITELSSVWRPLLHALAGNVPVRWIAGPRPVPDWLDGEAIEIVRDEARAPDVSGVSTATAYHEAVEAMRWARQLLASGRAEPADIAIASATPANYDDHLLALRADASLDLPLRARRQGHGEPEGAGGGCARGRPAARPLPDSDAAAELAAARLSRPVRGSA